MDCSTLLSDYLDQQLRRDAGMTHAAYSLLARLSGAPDHTLGMSSLAEQLKFTRSRLTRAVVRLEESGFVQRRTDLLDELEHHRACRGGGAGAAGDLGVERGPDRRIRASFTCEYSGHLTVR